MMMQTQGVLVGVRTFSAYYGMREKYLRRGYASLGVPYVFDAKGKLFFRVDAESFGRWQKLMGV